MALKGTAIIELTDINTGEKEIIKKDNLVTNAAMLALTQNPLGVMYQQHSGWFAKNMLPVCPNAIGGILCFEDTIEESVDQLYPPVGNHMTACSSNNVNPGGSTTRGNMNQTESGPLEDWSGYRFVFDFSTSQGNGKISSVALTSKWGGVAGMGDVVSGQDYMKEIYSYSSTAWGGTNEDMYAWRHIKTLDVANNVAISVYFDNNGDIHVSKLSMQLNNLALVHPSTEPLFHPNWNKFETTLVVPSDVFKSFTDGSGNYIQHKVAIHDGNDGYWWAFANAGNSSGNCTVYYAKISQKDYSIEEGSFTNEAKLSPCGVFSGFGYNNYSKNLTDYCYSAMANGRLYVLNYNKNAIYEIDLPSGNVLREITSPYSMTNLHNTYYNPLIYLKNIAGYIYSSGCIIGGEDVVYRNSKLTSDNNRNINVLVDGCYAVCSSYYSEYNHTSMSVYLFTPYLATINNLETPIEKTPDKTMKITYILREE